MYKIDKNIEMPTKTGQRTNDMIKTLVKMKIGDSFFVAGLKQSSNVSFCARFKGMKVTCRKENDGFRIWRIQ